MIRSFFRRLLRSWPIALSVLAGVIALSVSWRVASADAGSAPSAKDQWIVDVLMATGTTLLFAAVLFGLERLFARSIVTTVENATERVTLAARDDARALIGEARNDLRAEFEGKLTSRLSDLQARFLEMVASEETESSARIASLRETITREELVRAIDGANAIGALSETDSLVVQSASQGGARVRVDVLRSESGPPSVLFSIPGNATPWNANVVWNDDLDLADVFIQLRKLLQKRGAKNARSRMELPEFAHNISDLLEVAIEARGWEPSAGRALEKAASDRYFFENGLYGRSGDLLAGAETLAFTRPDLHDLLVKPGDVSEEEWQELRPLGILVFDEFRRKNDTPF